MRLINVHSLQFEEFDDVFDCPSYAILSHRWEEEEVTFQDALNSRLHTVRKKGIAKINQCCTLALQHSCQYVWIDTCCIDKSSSAELSEAINSMFRWYQLSTVCIAFLSDIDVGGAPELSLWFTRAWTLQELLAPPKVLFYGTSWQALGSKIDLADAISARTGIPLDVLMGEANIYKLPVAQRMSWARRRKCRRIEDIAYSLLGIFDVNMPLIYGEGKKAFRRLQEEIIKQSNDQTIFLWSSTAGDVGKLLAPSPDSFDPNRIFQFRPSQKGKTAFSVTNLGLSITLPLAPWYSRTYLALLDCEVASVGASDGWHRPGLYLRYRPDSDLFEKINFSARDYGFLAVMSSRWFKLRDIHIALEPASIARDSRVPRDTAIARHISTAGDEDLYGFVLRSIEVYSQHASASENIVAGCEIGTSHRWNPMSQVVEMVPGTAGDAVILTLPKHPQIPVGVECIKLGFDFDFHPCCVIGVVQTDRVLGTAQHKFSNRVESRRFLESIGLNEDQDWHSYAHQIVPLSTNGCWMLQGDLHMGLSVLLGPPITIGLHEKDYCFSKRQIGVRLTREPYRNSSAWYFDLRISSCPGTFCSTHKQERTENLFSLPEIIISPRDRLCGEADILKFGHDSSWAFIGHSHSALFGIQRSSRESALYTDGLAGF